MEQEAKIQEDQIEQTTQTVSQSPNQKPEGPDLNIQDLLGVKSIIDVATQRGAFKANELEAVGKLYNRLSTFLDTVAKPKE
jgi:hypothetical protein